MSEILCPRCPICGHSPGEGGAFLALLTGGTQVFCPNDDCDVLMWDSTLPDGGVSTATVLPDEPDENGVHQARPATAAELREAEDRVAGRKAGR